MGHTLVTDFTPESRALLRDIMHRAGADDCNKIPYGRDCDRLAANEALPLHITMFHWAKQHDEKYIRLLEDFRFIPCKVNVTQSGIMYAEESSLLLYFAVEPGENFLRMAEALQNAINEPTSAFLHMTIAADKDHTRIHALKSAIDNIAPCPFSLDVNALALYHIWKPVKWVRNYDAH